MFQAACAGIPAAGLEADARIGRRRRRRDDRRHRRRHHGWRRRRWRRRVPRRTAVGAPARHPRLRAARTGVAAGGVAAAGLGGVAAGGERRRRCGRRAGCGGAAGARASRRASTCGPHDERRTQHRTSEQRSCRGPGASLDARLRTLRASCACDRSRSTDRRRRRTRTCRSSSSCAAPYDLNSSSTMSIAPWWCLIMPMQEQPIELGPARLVERGHLLVGQHARHQHVVLHAVHLHLHGASTSRRAPAGRDRAASSASSRSRRAGRRRCARRGSATSGARAVRRRPAGHDHRLRVMRNHAGHEVDVGVGVGKPAEARRRGVQPGRRRMRAAAGKGGHEQERGDCGS